ncbi:MAG: tetraacyldisaccharide 4'-kinase [Phycisphaerae bacterium]|nr:tetraacyldisaccharide 4'-kinase [Phycisphaerae bacterium]
MAPHPTPPLPAPLGLIVEPIYRMVIARRNRSFDAGRRVARLEVPVVSIGNVSVGGTGKTPMVMRAIEWLRGAGRRPVIAMRGYGARPGRPSDEEAEYRGRFPDVPIVSRPDRLVGLRPVIDRGGADCVVLDDGFQHRFIARDLDIVLIDATRSPFEDRCLPAGWLREPVESLRRAGLLIVTHEETADASEVARLKARLSASAPRVPIAGCRHVWTGVRVAGLTAGSDAETVEPLGWLAERPVVAACAIGQPGAFLAGLRAVGARLTGIVERRDHHDWNEADANEVRARLREHPGSAVAMTEKDWVKFRRLGWSGMIVARPVLTMDLGRDEPRVRDAVLSACGAG